jgi:hypothetical protein
MYNSNVMLIKINEYGVIERIELLRDLMQNMYDNLVYNTSSMIDFKDENEIGMVPTVPVLN